MSFTGKKGVEKAFAMLRTLPRVCLANIRRNPGTRIRVNNTNDVFAILSSYQPKLYTNPEERTPQLHGGIVNVAYQ